MKQWMAYLIFALILVGCGSHEVLDPNGRIRGVGGGGDGWSGVADGADGAVGLSDGALRPCFHNRFPMQFRLAPHCTARCKGHWRAGTVPDSSLH